MSNRVFLDPIFRGSYPADLRDDVAAGTDMAFVADGDERRPLDLLGVNYYRRTVVRGAAGGQRSRAGVGSEDVEDVERGLPATEMAGRSTRGDCTTCSAGSSATTARFPST